MQTDLEITKSLEYSELKTIANTEGPCLTIYLPLETAPNTAQMDTRRLKSTSRLAEQELREMGVDEAVAREFSSSVRGLESEGRSWGGQGGSLVILRSPHVFRVFEVRPHFDESVRVGNTFHVFPLLHALQCASHVFYILALSKNNVRLLRCTETESDEVDLPTGTPRSLEEWLNTRPANASPNHESAEGSEGRTGSFTSAQDRDKQDEHLSNFYHAVDKGVSEALRDQKAPLVLCGVEYQRSMYKSLSAYPHVQEDGVQGSPESLRGAEMHTRALKVARDHYAAPARKALGTWENIAGTERALTKFPAIVKAAFEARIGQLFAAEDATAMGVFDREKMEMGFNGPQEDLVNAAALQTIANGGDVFILSRDDMPAEGQITAIARY